MTYDSDLYIQHISYTLTEIAKKQGMAGALEYATKKFAEPLGIPDLYKYDALGDDISAGGGQMMSCRDIARVGQLIVNKGVSVVAWFAYTCFEKVCGIIVVLLDVFLFR